MGEINVVDAPAQVMASEKEMLFLSDHAVSKKGNDTIKCSEDHIEYFQNNGFTLEGEKKVTKKSEKVVKQEDKQEKKIN